LETYQWYIFFTRPATEKNVVKQLKELSSTVDFIEDIQLIQGYRMNVFVKMKCNEENLRKIMKIDYIVRAAGFIEEFPDYPTLRLRLLTGYYKHKNPTL